MFYIYGLFRFLYYYYYLIHSFGKFHKIDECCIKYVTPLIRFELSYINVTIYDYNLTIMKSPKPATDNQFKK